MSVFAITWAYSQRTGKPGAKAVLVALANFANEDGECWPAQKTLAEMTDLDEKSVRRHLAFLERKGFLARRERRDKKGRRASDFYQLQTPATATRIQPDKTPARASLQPDNLSLPNRTICPCPTGQFVPAQPDNLSLSPTPPIKDEPSIRTVTLTPARPPAEPRAHAREDEPPAGGRAGAEFEISEFHTHWGFNPEQEATSGVRLKLLDAAKALGLPSQLVSAALLDFAEKQERGTLKRPTVKTAVSFIRRAVANAPPVAHSPPGDSRREKGTPEGALKILRERRRQENARTQLRQQQQSQPAGGTAGTGRRFA
jgi:hypothetical protein